MELLSRASRVLCVVRLGEKATGISPLSSNEVSAWWTTPEAAGSRRCQTGGEGPIMVAEGRISHDDRFKKVAEEIWNIFKETCHIRRSVCSFQIKKVQILRRKYDAQTHTSGTQYAHKHPWPETLKDPALRGLQGTRVRTFRENGKANAPLTGGDMI